MILHHGFEAPDVALFIARTTVGAFFAISGWHKLTNHKRHQTMYELMVDLHIPLPRFNSWWVAAVEFSGGAALIVGLLTPLASLGLLVICLTACCTDGARRIRAMLAESDVKDRAELIADVLYLPEALYTALLLIFILAGPGTISLDHYAAGWYK